MKLSNNVFYKKFGPKLIFFNEKKNRKIQTFFDVEIDFECPNVVIFDTIAVHCAISVLQISKNHFVTFDFFVKIKLVSNVVQINAEP